MEESMEKWTRSLTKKIDRLQQRVQTILENDGDVEVDPDAPPFEASRDPRLIDGIPIGLPATDPDRAIVVFNRLSQLFDSGLLLEQRDGLWVTQASFRGGIAKPWRTPSPPITLPSVRPLQALKTPAAPLLAKLAASELDPSKKCSAFLIKPVPEFAYVLMSSLPDLWLKDHLEAILNRLASGFSS